MSPDGVSALARPDALTFPALPTGLDTPRVVVDLARVAANIERLQVAMDRRGVALRPHAKTHKSIAVARMQVAAGSRGITVGTLGEAEVFTGAGIEDVFLAYPVRAQGAKATKLRSVHDLSPNFRVGVDSTGSAMLLAAANAGSSRPLTVLVEVDPGNRRTGVASPAAVVAVARAARDAGLVVDGVFSHGGHGYRIGAAEPAGADEVRVLSAAADALRSEGFACATVSAGSTPTMLTAATGAVTEIRAGTTAIASSGCSVRLRLTAARPRSRRRSCRSTTTGSSSMPGRRL